MDHDIFEPLETLRLHLRCVTATDAQATSRLMTPEVTRWVAYWPYPFTPEMAAQRIETFRRQARAGNALPFAVILKETGELLGYVMLNRDADDPRLGLFGYWLGEAYHGKGYMSEIAPVVLAAAFERFGIDTVEAAAQIGNAASLRVMRRCGMRSLGTGMIHAPARQRDELCEFFRLERPA